jgi:hypothetical protein
MMSQNRQDIRDRVVNDYVSKIILRNEHQTRHINAKVDHLLSFQWKRLLEIQEIQTVLMQIQRKGKKTAPVPSSLTGRLSTYRRNSQKSAQYYTFEINPDPFVRMLLRHAFDCDLPDDSLIFSHWHEEGDNFNGVLENVTMKCMRLKLRSLTFDLSFTHHQATLDDILTGENRIVMRNDFNLPHMNFTGETSYSYLKTKNLFRNAKDKFHVSKCLRTIRHRLILQVNCRLDISPPLHCKTALLSSFLETRLICRTGNGMTE